MTKPTCGPARLNLSAVLENQDSPWFAATRFMTFAPKHPRARTPATRPSGHNASTAPGLWRRAALHLTVLGSAVLGSAILSSAAWAQSPATSTPVAASPTAAAPARADASGPRTGASAPRSGAATPSDSPQKLDQIEVRGRSDADDRRQSTASRIVIGREEIAKFGDTSVSDVLKRVPGVTIGGIPGRGGDIRMRGLGAGFTRILINGEPAPRGFSLDSLSPDVIDRIEVMRTATAEFSNQAVAGAINIITRATIPKNQRDFNIGLGLENGLVTPQLGLRMGDTVGSMTYTINGNFSHYQTNRPSAVHEVTRNAAGQLIQERTIAQQREDKGDNLTFSPRLSWSLGKGETFSVDSFGLVNQYRGHPTSAYTTPVGQAAAYDKDSTDIDYRGLVFRTNGQYTKRWENGARLEASLGFNANRGDVEARFQGLTNAGAVLLDRAFGSTQRESGMSSKGKYVLPYTQGHAAAFGWDVGGSRRQETRVQTDTLFTVAGVPNTLQPDNANEQFFARVTQLAAFGQDEWEITPRLSLYAGMRWEGIQTKSEGSTGANFQNKSSVLSPIAQLLWKLPNTERDQVRLGLSRTYRAPNASSLTPRKFSSALNTVTSPDRQGNPNLRPELAWGLDTAYERYLPGGGVLSMNIFLRRVNDITRQSLDFVAGRWLQMPINNGVATTKGLELEAKFGLQNFDKELPRIDIRANGSVYSSKVDNIPGPNNRLEQQAPATANLGADWQVKGMPLTLGASLNVTTAGETRTSITQTVYGSVKRGLDAFALWRFSPQTQVRVSLSNGLAQDNIAGSTFVDANITTERVTVTPTKPILRATLTQRF